MVQLFFYSPQGFAPLKEIRNLLHGSHGWACPSGGIFGVAIPDANQHPLDVADALTALGVTVLPSCYDTTVVIPSSVATALADCGVLATDCAFTCATKMHSAHGIPHLRPHRY